MQNNSEWVISTSNRNVVSGFAELVAHRSVLYALVSRELKSRYRESFFGFIWALGKPVSLLLVFTFFIGEILGASRSIELFALYLFVGLMFWGFFAESLATGTNSIVNASGLVQKIAFPREILPLTSVVIAGINTLIQVPVLILGYLIFGAWPNFENFALLIPFLMILFFITLASVLILSAVNVYVRDIQPLTELGLMLLMYATPILYSWTFVQDRLSRLSYGDFLTEIYILNPINFVIIGLQDVLWPGKREVELQNFNQFSNNLASPTIWVILGGSFVFLLVSYKIFLKLEPNFAREL